MPDRTTKQLRAEIARAVEPVVERAAAEAAAHPALDELIRYHGGGLDDAGEEGVRSHLEACSECLETLLDLDGFVGAGAPAREGGRGPAPVSAWRPPATAAGGPSSRVVFAIAASVLVVISSLGVWVGLERRTAGDLHRQVARLSAPRPDVPIVDLLPDSAIRSEAGGPPRPELPPGDDYFTFVLNLPQASELGRFEAELVDPEGRITWSGPIERSRYGTFTLGLWRRHLTPGENRVRLYGLDAGGRRLLETYTFRVEAQEEDG